MILNTEKQTNPLQKPVYNYHILVRLSMQLYKKVNPITQAFEEFARHHPDSN